MALTFDSCSINNSLIFQSKQRETIKIQMNVITYTVNLYSILFTFNLEFPVI